jgi:apolipoprotein N-acyltransferase
MQEEQKSSASVNSSHEVENWIFSLIPVGVAFVFYVVFILQSGLDNANRFIAMGAGAGFIGLESYWIVTGLRNNRKGIVVMGLVGIAITLGALYLFL